MDSPTAVTKRPLNRLLPYWAVFQTDFRQTLRSWVYRLWVIMTILGAGGSILYKVGVHREAGIVQAASERSGDLLRGLLAVSLGLIALLAVSGIAGERATVADAVLSRGISRHQYFLAKWHSRLAVILLTFVGLAAAILVAHHLLLDPDVTWLGGVVAIALVAAILCAVTSWGVTIGALSNGTVMGITVFWIAIYGGLMLLSLLPEPYPSPDRFLARLTVILRGEFQPTLLWQVIGSGVGLGLLAAIVGLIGFGRKDV
jgi:ABC-2 type transport system permease protein